MNRPVEQLLAEFGERSGIQDVDHFAQVFGMARRSGGELVEIIRQSAGVIRDKIQVQEEIQTMTTARIFEQKIMNGIPFGMILYIDFTSPGFFAPLYLNIQNLSRQHDCSHIKSQTAGSRSGWN